MPNSIPMSWLYILTACIRVSSSFSFFANSLMSSMYIKWLIFSCDLLSLYPAVHFLSMWISGIMPIMNSKGGSSSWNLPLWAFASAKLLPPAVNSTFQVVMVFSIKFMTSSDIFYILEQFIIHLYGIISYDFLLSIQAILDFFVWSCSRLGSADLCKVTLLCLWIFCGILSVLQEIIRSLLANGKSLPLFVLLIFSTSSVSRLWFYSCLSQFPWVGPSGSMWSFLWSSIRVRVLLVSICSFLVLVCREWRWIYWTRIYV